MDIWNTSDSAVAAWLQETGATFPVCRSGRTVGTAYGVIPNSIVVVDQAGVVQFVQGLGTSSVPYATITAMVDSAAAVVRRLLDPGAVRGPAGVGGRRPSGARHSAAEATLSGRAATGLLPCVQVLVRERRLRTVP